MLAHRRFQTEKAFSLLELIIVVAITASLSAIAIPSYQAYIKKSRRSDAITALLSTQRSYELYFAQNNSYPAANSNLPSNTSYYTYSSSSTASTYTLTATAAVGSAQTSDTQGATACSILKIDNINNRSPQNCWNLL